MATSNMLKCCVKPGYTKFMGCCCCGLKTGITVFAIIKIVFFIINISYFGSNGGGYAAFSIPYILSVVEGAMALWGANASKASTGVSLLRWTNVVVLIELIGGLISLICFWVVADKIDKFGQYYADQADKAASDTANDWANGDTDINDITKGVNSVSDMVHDVYIALGVYLTIYYIVSVIFGWLWMRTLESYATEREAEETRAPVAGAYGASNQNDVVYVKHKVESDGEDALKKEEV